MQHPFITTEHTPSNFLFLSGTNKNMKLQTVSRRLSCWNTLWSDLRADTPSNNMIKNILPDKDLRDDSGPAGPWNIVMENVNVQLIITLVVYPSVCFLIYMVSWLHLMTPKRIYLGEFTEQHNRVTIIQQTLLISLIKSQQLLFVITTPDLVNTIQILLDKLIT